MYDEEGEMAIGLGVILGGPQLLMVTNREVTHVVHGGKSVPYRPTSRFTMIGPQTKGKVHLEVSAEGPTMQMYDHRGGASPLWSAP
jgi:hypothetical protein